MVGYDASEGVDGLNKIVLHMEQRGPEQVVIEARNGVLLKMVKDEE